MPRAPLISFTICRIRFKRLSPPESGGPDVTADMDLSGGSVGRHGRSREPGTAVRSARRSPPSESQSSSRNLWSAHLSAASLPGSD